MQRVRSAELIKAEKQRWLHYCRVVTVCKKISVYASVKEQQKTEEHGTINGTAGTNGGISGRQHRCRWVLFWCDSITSAWVQPLFKLPQSASQSLRLLLIVYAHQSSVRFICFAHVCACLCMCVCVCAFTTWLTPSSLALCVGAFAFVDFVCLVSSFLKWWFTLIPLCMPFLSRSLCTDNQHFMAVANSNAPSPPPLSLSFSVCLRVFYGHCSLTLP